MRVVHDARMDRLRAQTPPRVAPRLKGVVKNKGIKPKRKPKKR